MGNDYNYSKSKGNYNRGGGRDRDRQMHSATCDKCGDSCQVPFKPTTGKPVYCNNCFDKQGGRDNNSRSYRSSGGDRRYDNQRSSNRPQMHSATCDNCGKDCKVPFKPSSDKPIYCDNCFGNKRDSRGGDRKPNRANPEDSRQLKSLEKKINNIEAKIDHVLELLVPSELAKATDLSIDLDDLEEKPVKKKTKKTKKPKAKKTESKVAKEKKTVKKTITKTTKATKKKSSKKEKEDDKSAIDTE